MKPGSEPSVHVRAATLPDVPKVAAISAACPTAAGWTEAHFQDELSSATSLFVVAEREGAVVGYAVLWLVHDEAQILDVAVDPGARRQKAGRALLDELVARARAARCSRATLETRASNEEALALYSSAGFHVVGRRPKFYNDGADAVLMDLRL